MCVCVRVCKKEWVGCAEGARTVGVELQVQRLADFKGCCGRSSDSLAGTTRTTISSFFSHEKQHPSMKTRCHCGDLITLRHVAPCHQQRTKQASKQACDHRVTPFTSQSFVPLHHAVFSRRVLHWRAGSVVSGLSSPSDLTTDPTATSVLHASGRAMIQDEWHKSELANKQKKYLRSVLQMCFRCAQEAIQSRVYVRAHVNKHAHRQSKNKPRSHTKSKSTCMESKSTHVSMSTQS
jgi:hypothetical protein